MKTALFSLALPASTPLPSRHYPNYFLPVPQVLPATTPSPSREYPRNFPRVPQCLFPAGTPGRTTPLFPRVPQVCVGRSAAFIGPPIHQQPENHGAIQAGSRVARISSAAHRCLHDDERLALSRKIASSSMPRFCEVCALVPGHSCLRARRRKSTIKKHDLTEYDLPEYALLSYGRTSPCAARPLL